MKEKNQIFFRPYRLFSIEINCFILLKVILYVMINIIISTYIFYLGIFLTVVGFAEIIFPLQMFRFWKTWISHRLFFLHGLLMIAAGIPLAMYSDSFAGRLIFITGLIIVFTGPFVLIYPEKIKEIFIAATKDLERAIRPLMYADAIVRIAVGSLFVYSYLR